MCRQEIQKKILMKLLVHNELLRAMMSLRMNGMLTS